MPALKLVTTPPPVPSVSVLTDTVVERLGALNTAARELRAMGYRIVSASLSMERTTPEIRIVHGDGSIAPLLNRGRAHQWKTIGDKRIGYTSFGGVIVSWEEQCNS